MDVKLKLRLQLSVVSIQVLCTDEEGVANACI